FILECIRAGVDILDHCDFMDEECIEAIVEADILVLPSLYLPSKMLDMPRLFGFTLEQTRKEFAWMCNILPKAVEAGVKLCVGDDFGTPITPHGDYGKELAVYVEHANIEPLEVIRWATRNGAALLGRPHELGLIEAGRLADLIVVNGDPASDITLLGDPANIPGVMRGGVFYSGATLASYSVT
ncbi:MAG: amidohydrolase family protein, partial [Porticoccaceae bacterium]|nr:amidohydrolase family protein [Porticoccaceae bacterium]